MKVYGSAMPGGPLSPGHIPLPAPRPSGTDALTRYNQRPQRAVTPTATGRIRLARTQPDQEKP